MKSYVIFLLFSQTELPDCQHQQKRRCQIQRERGCGQRGRRLPQGIRFGLLAIKNMGRSVIEDILKERELDGPFTNFVEFCRRTSAGDLNRRGVESLIKCGALDHLGANRREMMENYGPLADAIAETP